MCLPAERPGNVIVFGFEREPGAFEWKALQTRAREGCSRYHLGFRDRRKLRKIIDTIGSFVCVIEKMCRVRIETHPAKAFIVFEV